MKGRNLRKKIVSAILVGVMTASMFLTGCGSNGSDGGSTGTAPAGDGTLDTSKEVELVMYVISDRPAGQDVVDENLNALLKEKLNCTLKINWIGWAEFANKYPLLFSSGEEFDIAYTGTWVNFATLAQKGAFKELDDLWPTYAPKNFAAATEAAKMEATVDGHYYCVPTQLATYAAYGAAYRTDILEGTDWPADKVISNLEDVEAYCDIVKQVAPELEPIDQCATAPEWYLFGFMPQNGMQCIDNGGRFMYIDPSQEKPTIVTPYQYEKTPEFLQMMARWNEKGFFSKNALADSDTQKTGNGKAALKFHNLDTYSGLAVSKPEWGFKYGVLTPDPFHLPFTQDAMVISNTSKNAERAMAFWELVTNDQEVYDAFMYGVKDVTYTLNDAGQYQTTDTNLYATSAMWSARTDGLNRDAVGTPEDYQNIKAEFEAYIKPGVMGEKYSAFVLDTSAIETEYANCVNVQQQYWWPLELAYTDAEAGLAEYQAKMEAAGIDKVVAEAQRQLDEYIANLK